MPQTVYTRQSRGDIRRIVGLVPAICAGKLPDAGGAVKGMQLLLGMSALSLIKESFVAKARGGSDEAGDIWEPLKRSTIANRRPAPRKKRGERPRGLLTKAQDARWRSLYARAFHRFDGDKAHAAAYAWFVLKAEGAKTKLDVYGGQKVEILRDTGRGLNSLSPGVDGPSGNPDQIFRHEPGAVIVGTNVKYMAAHHRGVPGKLPQRRLWPVKLPSSWWAELTDQAREGVIRLIRILVGGVR